MFPIKCKSVVCLILICQKITTGHYGMILNIIAFFILNDMEKHRIQPMDTKV